MYLSLHKSIDCCVKEPGQGLDLIFGKMLSIQVLAAQVVLSLHDSCFGCHLEIFEVEAPIVFLLMTG